MKKNIIILLIVGFFQSSSVAEVRSSVTADNPLNHLTPPAPQVPQAPAVHIQDPLRILDGTNIVPVGKGWVPFQGQVLEIQPDGVLIRTGVIMLRPSVVDYSNIGTDSFISHFPYTVAENDFIGLNPILKLYALPSGMYYFTNSVGKKRAIHKLEYGVVPTAEQIAAAKKLQQDKATARATKANQEAADKGDAYGLMRMGERYRDGDGVERDLIKARDYLTQAANAGSLTAQEELDKLPK